MTTQPLNLPQPGNDPKVAKHLQHPRLVGITLLAVFTSIAAVIARYLSRHSRRTTSQPTSEDI